jgi:hypothetical protein
MGTQYRTASVGSQVIQFTVIMNCWYTRDRSLAGRLVTEGISTKTRRQAGLRIRCSILGSVRNSLVISVSMPALEHTTQSPVQRLSRATSPGVKAAAQNSVSASVSAGLKHAQCTPIFFMTLYFIMHRERLSFTS